MNYLKEQIEETIVIQRSEFIAILYPIENDNDIDEALKDAKKRYPKATHYVTASIQGENGEYASSNDDGEPSRTAGYPTLDVLMQHKLTNVFCVVIRYFGGIKLGAGGLIRAYRAATAKVCESAQFYKKVSAKKYNIVFPYNLIDTVEHLLADNVSYTDKQYLENVNYTFVFLKNDLSLLKEIKHQFIEINELEEEILHIDIDRNKEKGSS